MKNVKYRIRITGMKGRTGTIPMIALKQISEALLEGSERALRLAVEGASTKRGQIPSWLRSSLDFTITGIKKGSTVLDVEAPTMETCAPEQIKQQRLWFNPPDPKDTAISILSRSVADASSERRDSERYDQGVLDVLKKDFEPFFKKFDAKLIIDSTTRRGDRIQIEYDLLDKVNRLIAATPPPQAVVLTGLFDVIKHTGGRFELVLEDGAKIPGVVDSTHLNVERMRSSWGKKVTIKGTAHFNPSGRMRFLEAQVIKSFATGEELFQSAPVIQEPLKLIEGLVRGQAVKSPLMEVWGKWPGEESIDELLSELTEMSKEER